MDSQPQPLEPQSQKLLTSILDKEPCDLTVTEIDFLKARRFYLTGKQIAKFAEFLQETVTAADPTSLSNRELIDILTARGIEIPKKATKEVLVKLFNDTPDDETSGK